MVLNKNLTQHKTKTTNITTNQQKYNEIIIITIKSYKNHTLNKNIY